MGVNMPAKTVIFAAVRKWDGVESRVLNTAEYIQMAGRAGRRGKDKQGLTIVMIDEKIEPQVAKTMFLGNTTKLQSAFYLGYNMLLNLLRMEDACPEYMIERSFRQFQRDKKVIGLKEEWESLKERLLAFEDVSQFCENEETVGAGAGGAINAGKKAKKKLRKMVEEEETGVGSVGALVPVDKSINAALSEFFAVSATRKTVSSALRRIVMKPIKIAPFLNSGRLVFVGPPSTATAADPGLATAPNWGWGMIVNFQKKPPHQQKGRGKGSDEMECTDENLDEFWKDWILNVFLPCAPLEDGSSSSNPFETAIPQPGRGDAAVVPCTIHMVQKLSSVRANLNPKEVAEKKEQLLNSLEAILSHDSLKKGLPELSPVKDLKHEPGEMGQAEKLSTELKELDERLEKLNREKFAVIGERNRGIVMAKFAEKIALETRRDELEADFRRASKSAALAAGKQLEDGDQAPTSADGEAAKLKDDHDGTEDFANEGAVPTKTDKTPPPQSEDLASIADDLRQMRSLLHSLGFLTNNDCHQKTSTVTLKGKLACELSSGDEVLLTELVFGNHFSDLPPEHVVALCSCLVFDENNSNPDDSQPVSRYPELVQAFEVIKTVAGDVATAMEKCGIISDKQAYVDKLKPEMMDVCMAWMEGEKFLHIMDRSTLYEGTIIRVIRRLEELIHELASATKSIGNADLERKLSAGRAKLKRGIIFAASLYL